MFFKQNNKVVKLSRLLITVYLIIILVLDLDLWFKRFSSDYTQRQKIIETSLYFKNCRRNTNLSYLFLVKVLPFSLFVFINYKVSTKQIPVSVIFGLSMAILTFYLFFSLYFYSMFEIDENRSEANETLEEVAVERLERIVACEQIEISKKFQKIQLTLQGQIQQQLKLINSKSRKF